MRICTGHKPILPWPDIYQTINAIIGKFKRLLDAEVTIGNLLVIVNNHLEIMSISTKTSPAKLPAWIKLQAHRKQWEGRHLRDLFAQDDSRFQKYSQKFDDFLLDYSKNYLTEETMALLLQLAEEAGLPEWTEKMLAGEKINHTESRAVLHIALRSNGKRPMMVDGKDVMPAVKKVLSQMRSFSDAVRNGSHAGFTGKQITDVVNIGVGGSDLGTAMVCEALSPYASNKINVHFLSNIDGNHFQQIAKQVHPETTLFVVASKTFTTQETMVNAQSAKQWLVDVLGDFEAVKNHFVAISSNTEAATNFGIAKENVFEFWDWVGGRFSLWSAIGLPIALYIGMDKFEELLAGAHEMDEHFLTADYQNNLPVIMAMLGIWHINFFGVRAHAVMPYDQHLHGLPAYLCQAEMESNGKGIDRQGNAVNYLTAPIVFGDAGTDGQHSFYQLLHQGTQFTTSDFIVAANSSHDMAEHHEILISNFFAQTEAFMNGRDEEEAVARLKEQKCDDDTIKKLLAYKKFAGDKPSTSIMYKQLTPNTLGRLIALYEHKIFIQGVIWNINSFDQMGVELGKELARTIQTELHDNKKVSTHDSSTNGLINYYKELRDN